MRKTVDDNGNIRINDLSFLDFSSGLMGFEVVNKQSGRVVPRFILFWKGLSIVAVKDRYYLKERVR